MDTKKKTHLTYNEQKQFDKIFETPTKHLLQEKQTIPNQKSTALKKPNNWKRSKRNISSNQEILGDD